MAETFPSLYVYVYENASERVRAMSVFLLGYLVGVLCPLVI